MFVVRIKILPFFLKQFTYLSVYAGLSRLSKSKTTSKPGQQLVRYPFSVTQSLYLFPVPP